MKQILQIVRHKFTESKEFVTANKKHFSIGLAVFFFLFLYGLSKYSEPKTIHYSINKSGGEFKNGRIFNSNYSKTLYQGKERTFNKKISEVTTSQKNLSDQVKTLINKVANMEQKNGELKELLKNPPQPVLAPTPAPTNNGVIDNVTSVQSAVKLHPQKMPESTMLIKKHRKRKRRVTKNRTITTFPVKDKRELKEDGIILPTGSYVKAKLLTGIEAPEGKVYPVLAELDYAYITPNNKRIDLSGCFMILKAQGDLSTERVQMQADKMSCVSRSGKMFERKINGFIADDKDHSFAVIGSVNSKQDRVAAMAFLSSIVEGVSKAIQQAQTTQMANAVGGTQSVLTGDQSKYILGGGVGNAASKVTDWYLKQAENLLPTINVGSGHDVYVIMGESVELPKEFFKPSRSKSNENIYSFYTNFLN